MKVQRVRHPQSGHVSWFVLDDGYHPISPITAFLTYLAQIERSPHTIRSYAHHLKLYWEYLQDAGLDWKAAGLSELADFVSWLRSPQVRVIGMHEQEARRSEATINVILTAVTMFYEYHARIGTVEEIPLYRSQLQPHRRYKGFLHHISKGKPHVRRSGTAHPVIRAHSSARDIAARTKGPLASVYASRCMRYRAASWCLRAAYAAAISGCARK
jgi:integrase/recombinase XerD